MNAATANLEKVGTRIPDKGLVSRIYKTLLQLSNKKTNHPIFKWAKELNRHSSKIFFLPMNNKHLKRCSTSLVIREMKIKATVRYHFISPWMAIIKK